MDMMMARIRHDHGDPLANWVADQNGLCGPTAGDNAQRMALENRAPVRDSKLTTAVRAMKNYIEDPLAPKEIAGVVGMSTRQLERLFARYLGTSAKRHYLGLRLGKARNLLRQTDFSVTDVCVACRFKSLSHFSKSYRAAYGAAPVRRALTHAYRGAAGLRHVKL
ncbi:MAG: helix-turn-helix domain-containing protein [Roseobacter sp.]